MVKPKIEELLKDITAGENVQIKEAILLLAEEVDRKKSAIVYGRDNNKVKRRQ